MGLIITIIDGGMNIENTDSVVVNSYPAGSTSLVFTNDQLTSSSQTTAPILINDVSEIDSIDDNTTGGGGSLGVPADIRGLFDLLNPFFFEEVIDLSSLPTPQTLTTTDNTPTAIPGSLTIAADTSVLFKTTIVGRQTLDTPAVEGADDNQYIYEIEGVVKNVADTLTLGDVTGIVHQEDFALPNDAITDHAITIGVTGTTLDFSVTGLDGTIIWRLETTLSLV